MMPKVGPEILDSPLCSSIGKTPLLHAARFGNLQAVLNILKVGAHVNQPAQDTRETALFFASEGGHEIVMTALINANADVNACNKQGVSPIYVASQRGHARAVQVLLNAAAEHSLEVVGGLTPLMIAAIRGKVDVIELLSKSPAARLDVKSSLTGETALMLCAISRDARCTSHLLGAGADPQATDRKNFTALTHAVDRNCVPIVELLLSDARVNIDHMDKFHTTALQHAQVS
jgi:ankyrin repeat protein